MQLFISNIFLFIHMEVGNMEVEDQRYHIVRW